jgi:hypothetical protein
MGKKIWTWLLNAYVEYENSKHRDPSVVITYQLYPYRHGLRLDALRQGRIDQEVVDLQANLNNLAIDNALPPPSYADPVMLQAEEWRKMCRFARLLKVLIQVSAFDSRKVAQCKQTKILLRSGGERYFQGLQMYPTITETVMP